MTLIEYLNLITSEFREQPNFTATLSANLAVPIRIQALLTEMMLTIFDVDTAVGDQLDIVGKWVGVSRNVLIPIGVFFTWDGDYSLGWNFGGWRPYNAPVSITELPDPNYRILIKARIAANHWDGTTDGAYTIWDSLFSDYTILIQDAQNMTYKMIVVGGLVDSITLALLTEGYIPLRPEGVLISEYYVPIDSNPLFGWDLNTAYLTGWNTGYWARVLAPS